MIWSIKKWRNFIRNFGFDKMPWVEVNEPKKLIFDSKKSA